MSTLIWLESTVHRLLDIYVKNVTRFVVPSQFFLAKLSQWSFNPRQLTYVTNFIDAEGPEPTVVSTDAFVYLGRMVPEKGVGTLTRAAARARVQLVITGTGADEGQLRQLAARSRGDITFTGHLSGAKLCDIIGPARAVVMPSEWNENAPISVMEASALGKPVIGARIDGIPERIRDGEAGCLFGSGNVESLTEALDRIEALPTSTLPCMGRAGREWMRAEFTPQHDRDRMLFPFITHLTPLYDKGVSPGRDRGSGPQCCGRLIRILEDLRAQREGLLALGSWALLAYRFGHARFMVKSKVLRAPWTITFIVLNKLVEIFLGISIHGSTIIGRRLCLEHHGGIVIHGATAIGDDCLIRHGVTTGNTGFDDPYGAPTIGNRMQIGARAKILGRVHVGNDAIIGANAVVVSNVPDDAVVGRVLARTLKLRAPK